MIYPYPPYPTPTLTEPGAEELEMYLDVLLRQAFIAPTPLPQVAGSSSGSNDTRFTKVTHPINTIDQQTAPIHPIHAFYQDILIPHSINIPYQHTSFHHTLACLSRSWQP